MKSRPDFAISDGLVVIVIDLDGDGLELTMLTAGAVYFDLDGNGVTERTSWVRPDDGLLVVDWDQDGLITSGSELFRPDFSSDEFDAGTVEPFAFSAFDYLRQFDSNYGKVDANDERFAQGAYLGTQPAFLGN